MTSELWSPNNQRILHSRMNDFIDYVKNKHRQNLYDYTELYQWSINDRPAFWQSVSDFFHVHFYDEPTAIIGNDCMPGAQWFPGSSLNYAEHLLRCQTNKTAIIFRGENGQHLELSYKQLTKTVASAQAGLIKAGIVKGDRVVGVLPNCPEAIIMMLATTALGAIWSSCSPDFGVQGIVDRFNQIEPKVLIASDGYFYNGKLINCIEKITDVQLRIKSIIKAVIVPFIRSDVKNLGGNEIPYKEFVDANQLSVSYEPVSFDHPLFIMYSSGTTGVPKCIIHGHGGTLLQHFKELGLHTDIKASDIFFYFTTCGWMMWNWFISALALEATIVLYDGSPFYPDPEALMDMVDKDKISIFGTSAKYISALEKAGIKPITSHNLSSLRTLLSTGSPLTHESFDYVYKDIKKDICLSSISGGTDIISCFALGCPLLPVIRGNIQCRGLGMDVQFVNDAGDAVIEEKGELTCQSCFPSMPVGFWDDPTGEKYQEAYFNIRPNIWYHGDYGELTSNEGVIIYGRSDAILNPGGVRIGTAEIYRQVEKINSVLESVAIGQEYEGDIRIILFVKLREGNYLTEALSKHIKSTILSNTTFRHVPALIIEVEDIPKTISGKIAELAVRDTIHKRPILNKEALANPEALVNFQGLVALTL